MKLPDDPQEQMKIFALIGIGVVGALVAAYMFGAGPILQKKAAMQTEIDSLEKKIKEANKKAKTADNTIEETRQVIAEIKHIAATYILKDELGSREIVAERILDPIIKKQGLDIDIIEAVTEMGPHAIKDSSKRKEPRTFMGYTVELRIMATYDDIVQLHKTIEESNPYLCTVSPSLKILGQEHANSEYHDVSFNLEWPIITDEEFLPSLDKQLEELDNPKEPEKDDS